MRQENNLWKRYWDSLSADISSDYELDRGVRCFDEDTERISEKKLIDFINPRTADYVLDAGCGTGVNLSRLSSKVKSLVGMDYSEGMINRTRKRIADEKLSNVRLIVGSVTDIPLESNSIDKIICISVMHYLNDKECEGALKEFVRISRDGAIIVLHIKNLYSPYLSTLYIAKKLKSLFSKNTKIEYYRPHSWYTKRLSALGARVLDYYSTNIFLIDILPPSLSSRIRRLEMKYYKGRLLRKYGADLHIKAEIRKG